MQIVTTPNRQTVALRDDGTWSLVKGEGSVLERWRALNPPRALVERFRGVFDKLGVRVTDTGELLTCIHRGDRIEFAAGIDESQVETTVSIMKYQADRLASDIERGSVSPIEWFRVARELLMSTAGAADRVVRSPLSSSRLLRLFIGARNLVHVYLVSPSPEQEPDATFSLIYVNGRSLLVPGLHGVPQRVFRLTVEDALEVQGKLGGAKAGGLADGFRMAKWYMAWRRKVERR